MLRNYKNLQLKSEKFDQKRHNFQSTKPFTHQNTMQNLSDLENKDTIPNNNKEKEDSYQVWQFLQRLQ
jgi:hypothetical protein